MNLHGLIDDECMEYAALKVDGTALKEVVSKTSHEASEKISFPGTSD